MLYTAAVTNESAMDRLIEYRKNPVEFVKTECRATPDDWQGDDWAVARERLKPR